MKDLITFGTESDTAGTDAKEETPTERLRALCEASTQLDHDPS